MAGRTAKSTGTGNKHYTKEELSIRSGVEEALRGNKDGLVAPDYLTDTQKSLFNHVKTELEAANILGNLDIYVLSQFAVCADRLREIEERMNESGELDRELLSARRLYSADFFRCCNELSLSPQSRAKIGSIAAAAAAEKKNAVLNILNDDN